MSRSFVNENEVGEVKVEVQLHFDFMLDNNDDTPSPLHSTPSTSHFNLKKLWTTHTHSLSHHSLLSFLLPFFIQLVDGCFGPNSYLIPLGYYSL